METKIRLVRLRKTQRMLLKELKAKGESTLDASTLSKIINRKMTTLMTFRINEEIEEILTKWEKEKKEQEVK